MSDIKLRTKEEVIMFPSGAISLYRKVGDYEIL